MATPTKSPFLSRQVDTRPRDDPMKLPFLIIAILLGLASIGSYFLLDSQQSTAVPAVQDETSPASPKPTSAALSPTRVSTPALSVSAGGASAAPSIGRPTPTGAARVPASTVVPSPVAANPTQVQAPPLLTYSPDTTIQRSSDGTALLTNSRLGFSFRYVTSDMYVIECQHIGETSDTSSYFVIDLSMPNRPQKCPVSGLVEDLYVSRKEEIDGIITVPTYTLKKNQLLTDNPSMSVAGEDSLSVAGVSGTRLRLTNAAAPPDGPNNRIYLTRNNVLFILSPGLAESSAGFSFQ